MEVADQVAHPATEIDPSAPTLQDVIQAIAASQAALEVKLDTLSIDLCLLRDDLKRLAKRVPTTEPRRRMITPSGVEFFSDLEEAWAWLESRLDSDPNTMSHHHKKNRRPRLRRRQLSHRIDPPTPKDAQEERQWLMAAVAQLGGTSDGSDMASPSNLQKEDEQSDSDGETATSTQSSVVLPVVTPGTADELFESERLP
ncbi:hypothetical protein NDU88_003894 [Pleurodeles waltl]|uniref:Uncharacterized protein n=1 Tax=Pleurodeles waltl TaxID=8319 RepID=A0AAV7NKR1_PLEWA|nr:hypothetical protein NDU88_003894 [Pleurodeles waltl]